MSGGDIELLSGIEAVRRRPTMYVGPLNRSGVPNFLLREALCCSRDDAIAGRCAKAKVTLEPGGAASVRDWGPGLPMEVDSSGVRRAERFLTELHACANAKPLTVAKSTCEVGLAVLNALSSELELHVFQAGRHWSQSYRRGSPLTELAVRGRTSKTGTEISFKLDAQILPRVELDAPAFVRWATANVRGLALTVEDRRTGRVWKIQGGK